MPEPIQSIASLALQYPVQHSQTKPSVGLDVFGWYAWPHTKHGQFGLAVPSPTDSSKTFSWTLMGLGWLGLSGMPGPIQSMVSLALQYPVQQIQAKPLNWT